jgi:hypothetical protein
MVAAMLALATAAATVGFVPSRPAWWPAAVALAVLGGIAPMIYAINIRIVPVFSRRTWTGIRPLRLQIACALAGAWLVYLGRVRQHDAIETTGHALALAGGIAFFINVLRLFRQEPGRAPAPPLPFPAQARVDKIATRFTSLSGVYLLVGLAVGLLRTQWHPATGRWDLVWAHALLVGFFLSMVAGVCYHTLGRWTDRQWKSVALIRLHFVTVALGLPLMLIALATNREGLFMIAGPIQAAALALFLINIAPLAVSLPGLSGPAVAGAGVFLLTGVGLGALFAIDPAAGARLRLVHADINLFGWTGLLMSGVGYYLAPRFAGRPLRWPRLAPIQLVMVGGGSLTGAVALAWRAYGDGPDALVLVAQSLIAAGLLLFGIMVGGTFRGRPGVAIALARPPAAKGNAVAPIQRLSR